MLILVLLSSLQPLGERWNLLFGHDLNDYPNHDEANKGAKADLPGDDFYSGKNQHE